MNETLIDSIGWERRRLKQIANRFYSGGTPDSGNQSYYPQDGTGSPWLMISDMSRVKYVRSTRKRISKAGQASRHLEILPRGTIVYAMYASVGAVAILAIDAAVNQAILGIETRETVADARFVAYCLENRRRDVLQIASTSTQANLSAQKVKDLEVFLPGFDEQELIVRYLDHAELRIAKAIAAKQQMITLLDEREELALLKAITQSNSSKTTDLRLDWLGEFPAHWEVKRLGALLEERNEMNADRQIQQVLSLVRKRGVMRYEDKGRIGNKRSDDVGRYKIVREGDIVVNSMNVIIGSVGQSAYTGCLSPVYYVLKPRSNDHHNAFFNAIFQVERFHSSLVRFGKGILAHRMRIPMIDLKTVMLPVPPLEEQLLIAERVVESTGELRAARSSIQSEIDLLKEYRTRLISDVVTGKLDVRAEAAKLPVINPEELAEVTAGAGLTAEDDGDDE
jgi:type I restriction enzyme S subunit